MNSLYVFIFTVLSVIATPIFSQTVTDDLFDELIQAKAPIENVIEELMYIDPETNYDHFQAVQDHIKQNDKHAAYAQSLITAAQKLFDQVLSEIRYKEKVDVVKFIEAAYGMFFGTSSPNDKMLQLIKKVNAYGRKVYIEAQEESRRQMKKDIAKRLMEMIEEGGSGNQQNAPKPNKKIGQPKSNSQAPQTDI